MQRCVCHKAPIRRKAPPRPRHELEIIPERDLAAELEHLIPRDRLVPHAVEIAIIAGIGP